MQLHKVVFCYQVCVCVCVYLKLTSTTYNKHYMKDSTRTHTHTEKETESNALSLHWNWPRAFVWSSYIDSGHALVTCSGRWRIIEKQICFEESFSMGLLECFGYHYVKKFSPTYLKDMWSKILAIPIWSQIPVD